MARGEAFSIQAALTFETEDCITCGVVFAIPQDLRTRLRGNKQAFYCPNGHSMSYKESEADRLRKQLDDAKRDADWQRSRATSLDGQLQKERKASARLKKRVNCGVCPHCQRTVKQMAMHIKTKHPEVLGVGKASGAVDPHVGSTGTPSTRAKT